MPTNNLPGTLETKHDPIGANVSPPSTTAAETGASGEQRPGLDLRGYELLEQLGGGGMGDVYRAGDPALGRDLAIKVMKADLQGSASAERRFLREARVTGSLQHPGIVPIYNLGRLADGRLHYTMRLVRGRTLADILQQEAGRPEHLPALLTIFEKVCQAVAYAHSKQVIHRDLKPANVMVGRFGEVQVMDWGLAKLLTAEDESAVPSAATEREGTRIHTEAEDVPLEQTRLGREMGTPAYMSPEQALGEWDTVDERADVFALGAMLCEILTGQPPYSSSESREALRKAKRGELAEALTRLASCGADAALLRLCRDCLAPAREGRPRDAEVVAQRVSAYQTEVQERLHRAELERAAAVVQAREEGKRRRWMLAAMLLLLTGAAVSAWQAVRATNAERLARENEGRALTAAEAERQANDLAQTRLNQLKKANQVLASLFRDLDPRAEEEGGPSLRQQLNQHLERAATPWFTEVIRINPAYAPAYFWRGYCFSFQGQYDRAIADYSEAITLNPLDAYAYSNRGVAYGSKGDYARAVADCSEAIRLRPPNARFYDARGWVYNRQGVYDRAIADCSEAIRRDPEYAQAFFNRAEAHLAKDEFDQAIADYTEGLRRRPDAVFAYHNRASCYFRKGDYDRAIADETEAIRFNPQYLHAFEGRANAYEKKGDHARAQADWETAVRLDPSLGKTGRAKTAFDPTSAYARRTLRGFAVYVNPKALAHREETDEALRLLESKLAEITTLVRPARLKFLLGVKIWVEWDSSTKEMATYHVSADWLKANGYNPEKAGSVEIENVRNFLKWTREEQPMSVLHELAHAYYFQVLGGKSAESQSAYDHAVKTGLYKSVPHVSGGKKRAYALTNVAEYFAELSEAYFGRNDFYPFTRRELREYDPVGYQMIEKAWEAPGD